MSKSVVAPNPGHLLGLSADEVLTTTRAVRRRLDLTREVSRETVMECVQIATQAPSGRNRQRWDFVFIQDQAMKAAVARVWRESLQLPSPAGTAAGAPTRMDFSSPQWARVSASLQHLVHHIEEVPLLLIACLRVQSRSELETIQGQAGAWGSVIPALWSFMLAARERGIGTAWTTSHLALEQEMADILSMPYDNVVQVALTPVAYTIGTDFKPGPRADEGDFAHWDRW